MVAGVLKANNSSIDWKEFSKQVHADASIEEDYFQIFYRKAEESYINNKLGDKTAKNYIDKNLTVEDLEKICKKYKIEKIGDVNKKENEVYARIEVYNLFRKMALKKNKKLINLLL